MQHLTHDDVNQFQNFVYRYFQHYGRTLPWRFSSNPWHIFVSEIMLQQTRVSRVAEKFPPFIAAFPTPQTLAAAPFAQVMALWNGLGYNRRARFLHDAARHIAEQHGGQVPCSEEALTALPGIGAATASAIRAYAFNQPVVFIETNIRAVYIHHFFPGQDAVSDEQLLPLVTQTLDAAQPSRWYNALMDYGVLLKKTMKNPARRSKHHTRQSTFEGSDRQLRGRVIRILLKNDGQLVAEIVKLLSDDPQRGENIIQGLVRDEIVHIKTNRLHLGAAGV
jgi:A/G-specific adenine glycosylase